MDTINGPCMWLFLTETFGNIIKVKVLMLPPQKHTRSSTGFRMYVFLDLVVVCVDGFCVRVSLYFVGHCVVCSSSSDNL